MKIKITIISIASTLLCASLSWADTPKETSRNVELRKCTANGRTTNDIEVCVAGIVGKAEENLQKYVEFARKNIRDDKETLKKFEASEEAFNSYKNKMSDLVYQYWIEGTIRGTKSQCCLLRLIDERALSVWEEFLQFQDGTPPLLPRPQGQLCTPQ